MQESKKIKIIQRYLNENKVKRSRIEALMQIGDVEQSEILLRKYIRDSPDYMLIKELVDEFCSSLPPLYAVFDAEENKTLFNDTDTPTDSTDKIGN